jgi:hypothetical protein
MLAPSNATPFDAASLGTWLEVTPPGGGAAVSVVPFYTAAFVRSRNATSGEEILTPSGGAPGFAARFSPRVLGTHAFVQKFLVTPPPAWLEPVQGTFECVAAGAIAGDGFAHVDKRRGTYFTLDDESAFFLVGENMAWSGVWPYFPGSSQWSNGTGGTYAFDRWLPKLAAAGGNFIRLWLGPSLVRQPEWLGERGTMLGLALMGSDDGSAVFGEYNLAAAWRVDYIVELCRQLGVKIALVLDAQQAFCELPGTWCFWNASTYNVANNGPLSDPSTYYTTQATLFELRQRWAYVVSRWGYSTSIFSWELANGESIITNPEPRPRRRTLTVNFNTLRQPRSARPNHNPRRERRLALMGPGLRRAASSARVMAPYDRCEQSHGGRQLQWEQAYQGLRGPAAGCLHERARVVSGAGPCRHCAQRAFLPPWLTSMLATPRRAAAMPTCSDWPDTAALVWATATQKSAQLSKPCFVEEFGASWQGPLQHVLDPTGIGMHTGAWASLCGLAGGTAMQWWWK